MRVIGFNLLKISVEKEEQQHKKVEIKQDIDIEDVSKEKVPFSNEEIIKITFSFVVNYNPDFAKLELKGNVMVLPEKDELKDFLKSWKSKQIPEDKRINLFNFIMSKCNVRALDLEDQMNLPLHLPMPRLNPDQQPPK